MSENQTNVVGVRFSKVGKVYHFDCSNVPDLKIGDAVVVETSRGWQLGIVASIPTLSEHTPGEDLKKIDRRATPRDLLIRQGWHCREAEVVMSSRERSRELNLEGVKIVAAEYSFDGTKLLVMFSTESEDKVDLKSLRKDLQKKYSPAQVEIRQIGPRDVAKAVGGIGACGLESRCCCRFLTDFNSISIKMAKEQGISLTPAEITGICGRLRCCLIYEFETYSELRKNMPKRNKLVKTPMGEGKVVEIRTLSEEIVVEFVEEGRRVFKAHEVEVIENRPA